MSLSAALPLLANCFDHVGGGHYVCAPQRIKCGTERSQCCKLGAEEAEPKRNGVEKSSNLGPILIAVWTAAIAAIGNGVVSWFNGQQMHRLESAKAQSAVILEVVKTNSPDKAANNLAFLVEIGVISQEQAGERHLAGDRSERLCAERR